LVVAFQPHRFSRTRDLLQEFATAFNDADVLFLTGIYPAGEEPIPGIDAAKLEEAIVAHGHRDVTRIERRSELANAIQSRLQPGDLVLTLGAGDITQVGPELLQLMRPSNVARPARALRGV
jgi:UDP-N-acetylmuramate--alanine ligase